MFHGVERTTAAASRELLSDFGKLLNEVVDLFFFCFSARRGSGETGKTLKSCTVDDEVVKILRKYSRGSRPFDSFFALNIPYLAY